MYMPASVLPSPAPLREPDRMTRYGSLDEEDDEEATAEVVRCNDIHEML